MPPAKDESLLPTKSNAPKHVGGDVSGHRDNDPPPLMIEERTSSAHAPHTFDEPISAHDKVPLPQKIAYGMGVISHRPAMLGVAMLLGTVVLEHVVGYDSSLKSGQPTAVLENMKLSYVLIPCTALFIAFFLLLKYPLTHHKLREIRDELESRRDGV